MADKNYSLRLDKVLKDDLKKLAKIDGRTFSGLNRYQLMKYYEENKHKLES